MAIAERVVERIDADETIERAWVAPPGFVNFSLAPSWLVARIEDILEAGPSYGSSNLGAGRRVQVEFVSVNPDRPASRRACQGGRVRQRPRQRPGGRRVRRPAGVLRQRRRQPDRHVRAEPPCALPTDIGPRRASAGGRLPRRLHAGPRGRPEGRGGRQVPGRGRDPGRRRAGRPWSETA